MGCKPADTSSVSYCYTTLHWAAALFVQLTAVPGAAPSPILLFCHSLLLPNSNF